MKSQWQFLPLPEIRIVPKKFCPHDFDFGYDASETEQPQRCQALIDIKRKPVQLILQELLTGKQNGGKRIFS